MVRNPLTILFVVLATIGVSSVVGAIAWVHYIYLPHQAAQRQDAPSAAAANAQPVAPETAAAIAAIQELMSGLPEGYLASVPVPHVLSPVSTTISSTFNYLGLTFSVPWKGISKERILGTPPVLPEITFSNGRSLTLMRTETPTTSTLAQVTSESSTIQTNYDFESAVFNASPDQISSSTPGDQAALVSQLLNEKLLLFAPSPVYSFDSADIRGFQHGDAATTKQILINLFDQRDDAYNLLISGTQGEIDYILASITSTSATQ